MAASTSPRRTGAGRGQVMSSRGMAASGQRKAAAGVGVAAGAVGAGATVSGGLASEGAAGSSELQPDIRTTTASASRGPEWKRCLMPGS